MRSFYLVIIIALFSCYSWAGPADLYNHYTSLAVFNEFSRFMTKDIFGMTAPPKKCPKKDSCDSHSVHLNSLLSESKKMVSKLEKETSLYLELIKSIDNPVKKIQYRSFILAVKARLICIRPQLKYKKFDCSEKSKLCKTNQATAWVNWIFGEIKICPVFWNTYHNDKWRSAVLVHEASHKCGTFDLEYHSSKSDLKWRYYGINSSHNADDYDMWAYQGFCIPGWDCNKKASKPKGPTKRHGSVSLEK